MTRQTTEGRGARSSASLKIDFVSRAALTCRMITSRATFSRGLAQAALICLVLALTLAGRSANADPTPSALQASSAGWLNIMPPADLKGWSRVPVPPNAPLGKQQWHVEDIGKTLVCEGDGGHDMLLCDREFGDAVFHFEFRYTKVEGKTGYNSGAYARNSKDGAIWHQAQFGDANGGYLFGQTPGEDGKKKSFSTQKDVKDSRVKPVGEWNTLEITARGATMTLWVNGEVTCEFKECAAPKGLVGLEGEGYRIEFRNLKVKELR